MLMVQTLSPDAALLMLTASSLSDSSSGLSCSSMLRELVLELIMGISFRELVMEPLRDTFLNIAVLLLTLIELVLEPDVDSSLRELVLVDLWGTSLIRVEMVLLMEMELPFIDTSPREYHLRSPPHGT